jgi:hypothetical protein
MTTKSSVEIADLLCDEQLVGADVAVETTSFVKAFIQEPIFLKVAVQATADNVRVSFDPVSVEGIRQTREINRSVRLGFVPPAVSTR